MTNVNDNSAKTNGSQQLQVTRGNLLIVDTDPGVRWALERSLVLSGYQVFVASTEDQAMRIAEVEKIEGIVMELMPDAGLSLPMLTRLLETPSSPRLVCTSVDAAPQTVIECMRRGASDFLLKPYSLAEVRASLSKATASEDEQVKEEVGQEEDSDYESSLLVGVSPAIQELRMLIKQVSRTNLNCLIRGESGVGKDVVAREIHRTSMRRDRPFVKINCSALPDQLLESELFGFEKGAFTGAVSSKPGRFSLADKGIIFLDEICEVHSSLQAKLLQVIEHKEFTKLGGRGSVKVDVQIIAATNADIEEMNRMGSFRQDLTFRLNEVCLWVPPLHERREDIPLLIRHFMQKYKHFSNGKTLELSGEELATLSKKEWPGNIRELESTIKRWLVLGKTAQNKQEVVTLSQPTATPDEQLTPESIRAMLDECQWNRRKAAQMLGVSYQVLRRRIERFNLAEPK
jgi:two-component system response regulator AtoC